jgi:RNA polymerase sigma factor (TIGR02999 family)
MDRPHRTSAAPPPPSDAPPADVTGLLLAWGRGDQSAADQLVPAVYDELRRQAERAMRREGGEHTLQATALVHESYLRLVDHRRVEWKNRAHFFAIASTVMRRILVDHARARLTAKRGGGAIPITLAGDEGMRNGDCHPERAQRSTVIPGERSETRDLHFSTLPIGRLN